MKALVLDFDGVLSDSALESFVVALRTYARLRPQSGIAAVAAELAGADPERVRLHPVYRGFVELMPLGNRAEDFGVVLHVLDPSPGERGWPEDQAAYDARRAAEAQDFLDAFHDAFYRTRAELRAEAPAAWLALLRCYAPVVRLLRRRAGEAALCIATAKDRPSVELLLAHYGLAELFPPERVVDKDHGTRKREHVIALQGRLGVDFAEITFVDDKVNHLLDVSGLGVRCALAAWGYNGERERRLARDAGYLVCTLDDVEAQLFAATAGECDAAPRPA